MPGGYVLRVSRCRQGGPGECPAIPGRRLSDSGAALTWQRISTPRPPVVLPVRLDVSTGIPVRARMAYQSAALRARRRAPACHLPWTLLAAIGRVESDHGRFDGSGLTRDGVAVPAIFGPRLTGAA